MSIKKDHKTWNKIIETITFKNSCLLFAAATSLISIKNSLLGLVVTQQNGLGQHFVFVLRQIPMKNFI
jgi:hypothetical protein